MHPLQLLPVLAIGLAGSIHCVGMCGGIVGAMTASAPRTVIPLVSSNKPAMPHQAALARILAYNAGRISSYMLAGAAAGGLAGGARNLAALAGMQLGLYWLANLMLVALGLYLMNAWQGLAVLEQGGGVLWRRAQPVIAPMMKALMPASHPHQAFALGALWGWLPCGMVYSVLLTAMLSGSAASGAAVMLAFGLGTLPMLTGLGLLGARLQHAMRQPRLRIACGVLVLGFGLLGLTRAAGAAITVGGMAPAWMDTLCLSPLS